MKVLYLNHTGQMSGGEQSLITLLARLPHDVSATVACPPGPLAKAAGNLGVPTVRVPGMEGSLKLHPWHTGRGLFDIGRATLSVRRLATKLGADLVHANSIRAGLVAAFAASAGGPPAVVHIRDCLPPGRLSSLTLKEIGKRASVVLSNSHYTKASFTRVCPNVPTRVVHSPVDLERFDPATIEPSVARARLDLGPSTFVLALIAQITPWKGQDDAIRILGHLKSRERDLRLLLVGSPKFISRAARYDNRTYALALERLTVSLGLRDDVMFLGERDDIPEILRAVDVLLVPSWEEPFGRTIIEAMAMGVPVVATEVGGPSEIVDAGRNGLLLPPRAPERWAASIASLIGDPVMRAGMSGKARQRVAAQFGVEAHVERVLAVYEEALRGRAP